jgi:hypothetical protein
MLLSCIVNVRPRLNVNVHSKDSVMTAGEDVKVTGISLGDILLHLHSQYPKQA